MRTLLAGIVATALFSCAGHAQRGPLRPPDARRAQPVVVAIVVDQLSAWVATSRLPRLPPGRGLTRLVREGTWAKRMVYPYAATDTAPGHAALHTGKLPSESGLFANELPAPDGKGLVSILRDESVRLVTPDGVKDVPGASAARLRAETVADRLRAARPDSLIVSVSLKDRGAIVPGGKKPSHVFWFDTSQASFVTSTAFGRTFPPWAARVGDARAIKAARAQVWEPLDRDWLARSSSVDDDAPGEGDLDGLGTAFPHVAKTAAAFRATPASDRVIVELALAAVKAGYDREKPTLVLVSFSASDVIGHVFGPDSWEAWDHLARLDATIGDLIEGLESLAGSPEAVSVLLSADHGNVPMPEATQSRATHCDCTTSERISPEALTTELRAVAAKALGRGDWIAGVADPYVYLSSAARALPEPRREALDRAIRAVLRGHEGVREVLDAETLGVRCPGDDALALVCRSWPGPPATSGAGDYYVLTAPGSFFDSEITTGKGTSHGTAGIYDRTVPLLVRARGRVPEGAVIEEPIDFSVFASLEASLLGLEPRPPREILDGARMR